MPLAVIMEGSVLTAAWTEISEGVTQLATGDYTKFMILLPIAAIVIGISKGMFSRKRR